MYRKFPAHCCSLLTPQRSARRLATLEKGRSLCRPGSHLSAPFTKIPASPGHVSGGVEGQGKWHNKGPSFPNQKTFFYLTASCVSRPWTNTRSWGKEGLVLEATREKQKWKFKGDNSRVRCIREKLRGKRIKEWRKSLKDRLVTFASCFKSLPLEVQTVLLLMESNFPLNVL